VSLDAEACYRGVFYVASAPPASSAARPARAAPSKRENCEFFADARQAMLASYRPGKRCRPALATR
jgi:AraC family transcriptional regulator, regulatory protein of adaptative response / methylated-DNA-[protein]-cysteine methyltransferase